ncbi:tyrosine--tRNA ligase [Buchnera aphidicola (Periphyllus koelreuteriae)]|uniref:tyrosine--tRNA ligase n=1 Tax=Buchnera aphidicola TaxID=9 RepID=UPI0031B7F730
MFKKSFLDQLKNRKLISQITNDLKIDNILKKQVISVYCGFDPTADSLHVGHMLPLLFLRRFQLKGHTPIILIGGATSLIGDPSFKLEERKLFNFIDTSNWVKKIKNQISLFLDFSSASNKAIIVNNYNWFKKINILSFLRNIGKHFSINQMINKESVKKRIKKGNKGLSFTEFSYSLLQAYDFSILYKKYNTLLQIGGSDQWGNITSGISLTNFLYHAEVFGLTLPLLTTSTGEKFGKSGKNTIWLDPKKTTPYEFYQFWLNTTDENIYNYLKYFTFLKIKEINKFKKNNNLKQTYIKLKKILAKKMTCLVHGKKNYKYSKKISKIFFIKKINNLNFNNLKKLKNYNAPYINLKKKKYSLKEVLCLTLLASSLTNAKDLIKSNSISINYKKQNNIDYIFSNLDKLYKKYTIISRGKKNFFLLIWK